MTFNPKVRPSGFSLNRQRRAHYLVTVKDQSGVVIACVHRYDDPGEPVASVDVIET